MRSLFILFFLGFLSFFYFGDIAFANPPFASNDLNLCKEYLLENITTSQRTFNKFDHGRWIRSIPGAVLASPSNKGVHSGGTHQ